MKRVYYAIIIALLTFALWEIANRPVDAPHWSDLIEGVAYSPMRPGQSPITGELPTEAEIEADIEIIAAHAKSIRTYGVDGTLARIPEIAAKHLLAVTVGVTLTGDAETDRLQLEQLLTVASNNTNIERIIIGNETLLTEKLTPTALTEYLTEIRTQLDIPVSTAEPWHIWLQYPELVDHVDYITVHLLPYWEGAPADVSVPLVTSRIDELEGAFPDKPIVIGEVGWPSHGRSRGAAEATRRDAQAFLRAFLNTAQQLSYDYFLMEAFDQPWKRAEEGAVGAYWGLFDGARRAKYSFDETLIPIPERRTLALFASIVAVIGFVLLSRDATRLRWQGLLLFSSTAFLAGNAIVWALHDFLHQYWTAASVLAAMVLVTGLLGIVVLTCIEVHEWAEANYSRHLRLANRALEHASERQPKVSIHLPAYAEPPAMLIETLNALARLDYPDYEVLVIDNNTRDPALWRPVEAHCRRLGRRFRFFHVSPLAGYKAGALNFALEQTDKDAEIVAVIDADYVVRPDWLSSLVPYFSDPLTALVQAPQDYRDHGSRAFKRFCEAEYRGFFHIGMVTRNERNSIIQHGTMTMIRASVLREVGRWADWTVTEDAELGLRILEHGYNSIYTTESFGRGLTPDRFRDYRSQRYRWAKGATQILKTHSRMLFGLAPSRLTPGQRFHFLAGWAAWLGDGLNLVFNLIAIGWSSLMVLAPLAFLAPVAKLSGFVLAFFAFKLIKMAWLYKTRVRASTRETLAAIIAGLSLVFITGRAVIAGFFGSNARFVRTPKLAREDSATGAIASVACELLLAGALVGLAAGVAVTAPFETIDRQLWSVLLLVFAIPHFAAVALALLGAEPMSRRRRIRAQIHKTATEAPRS